MQIFLTGGTGFIGARLVAALRWRTWRVTALVRRPDSAAAREIEGPGVQLAAGDVTERESMRAAMAGADLVIHNAGAYEFGVDAAAREHMTAVNVQGTDHVLGLAAELGVPRSVYVSTTWAYGPSGNASRDESFERLGRSYLTHYERTKHEAHEVALEHGRRGLPLTIVCPNGVIGPNDHSLFGYLIRLYIAGLLPPVAWSPGSTYTFVDVLDLAEGIALAAERGGPGETYLLCGEELTLRRTFEIWSRQPGGARRRVWLPPALLRALFAQLEPLQRAAGLPAVFSRETVDAGTASLNYSSAKAQRELGWSHRGGEAMWQRAIEGERNLLRQREAGGLLARLKPLSAI